ncbi:MAG: transglutaminase family protein [Pirellulales bacterium]
MQPTARHRAFCLGLAILAGLATAARGDEPSSGPALGEQRIVRLRAGLILTAVGGNCPRMKAMVPVPIDWPEQTVEIVERDVSPRIKKLGFRDYPGSGKMLEIDVPGLLDGEEARAVLTFEVHRSALVAPGDTDGYTRPDAKKLKPAFRPWLKPGPGIPSTDKQIKALAEEIAAGQRTDWQQAQAIHDWINQNIKYEFDEEFRGAAAALNNRHGDCEELTCLFISLCRAQGIPARTVWVPGHCYPEFYLQDASGEGHWFPLEATSPGQFGGIADFRPILQKGDDFASPEKKGDRWRYLRGTLKGFPTPGATGQPKLEVVLEIVPAGQQPQEE